MDGDDYMVDYGLCGLGVLYKFLIEFDLIHCFSASPSPRIMFKVGPT